MNMRCSTVIMAHPSRSELVEELQSTLDRDVPVVYDGKVKPSKSPQQRWRTGRRAWEAIDRTADYGMVIQDDVLVSRDFIAGVESALNVLGPEGLVSAYTGTGRPDQTSVLRALDAAERQGSSWTSTRSLNWGPAIIVPTSTIEDMLYWCDQKKHAVKNYDYRIGLYFRDVVGWRTWYLVPSLVEHRDVPSLVGHDAGPKREAHNFIGCDKSALDVDWSRVPREGLEPKLRQ